MRECFACAGCRILPILKSQQNQLVYCKCLSHEGRVCMQRPSCSQACCRCINTLRQVVQQAAGAANGASPRPASAGAKQLPARPAPPPPGMKRGLAKPSQQGLADAAPPAPPATPPPSASGGPKAGGGSNPADTPQRVSSGGPDRGVPAPATPAASGRPVSAPKPAKAVDVPVIDGDATGLTVRELKPAGAAVPPGEAAETAALKQFPAVGGAAKGGGPATASRSNGSEVEMPAVSVRPAGCPAYWFGECGVAGTVFLPTKAANPPAGVSLAMLD